MKGPRLIAAIFAIIALLICIIAPLCVFMGDPANYEQNFATYKTVFGWNTLLWFISAPFWLVPEVFQKEEDQ